MAWDLVLSDAGDLIFGPNRDLAGISGTDLIEQRMKIRLRVHRGSWVYDTNGSFGSNLTQTIGMPPDQAHTSINAFVREALRPMADEIEITDIVHWHEVGNGQLTQEHTGSAKGVIVVVHYRVTSTSEGGITSEERQLQI